MRPSASLSLALALGTVAAAPASAGAASCARTLTARVVAIDQPLMFNRLGASNVNGMAFALRRDTVELVCQVVNGVQTCTPGRSLADPAVVAVPGRVAIRPDRRPRPLVL